VSDSLRAGLEAALASRYTIERELGRGGMATVYLARDLRHDRPVALKVLHPELAATLGPERFLREIKLAARLQHPHILTVLDSGESAGRLWFTMPYVEGESLRDRLSRETQLPVADALRIAREAATALDYAHRHDTIHRDVKPENLLLTSDGQVLVADFGIGRALSGALGPGSGGAESRLTETGMVVGTAAYMSPEQASGQREVDGRTDVYSLGVVLYEMLVGETPFTGPTAQAIIAKRFSGEVPSVRKSRPSVAEEVERVVAQALAMVPADRFATAGDLAKALDAGSRASGQASGETRPTSAHTPAARALLTRPLTAALAIGFLLGLGVLFAWRRNHPGAEPPAGERRVAVLPFENLGDSADAYFADGITDAVRGKLTAIPGMRVTASNSSSQYRGTSKSPQEIGRELGVDYLLTGKVRWQKGKDGASRVQVSPELIEVATADAKWQQPFDAALTDVFQVQADVAGRVAQALDLAIGTSQQRALADRPTANLAAYDSYLKAEAARALGNSPVTLRQATGFYEHAVALDSSFVAAWAGLSESSSLLYAVGTPSLEVADRARSAADRALALDSEHPDGYRALGDYYRRIPATHARAIEQYAKGLKLAPGDANLLRGLGLAEQSLGQWEQSVEHLRRSQSLDPRSVPTADALGQALLWLRRYPESLAAFELALALEPATLSSIEGKAMNFLAQADLGQARAALASPPAGVDLPAFVAYMGAYLDLYWPLADEQRALLRRLTPAAFDGDAATWGLALAGAYEVEGDMKRAAAYGDSARAAFEQQLTARPEDPQRLVLLGVALAYMGRRDEAVRAGEQGLALQPISKDAQTGPYLQHQLARIYVLVGEPDKALDQLEPLLKIPYYLSPGWLRIDPTFEPLRKHPRFRKLAGVTR
jgi:serine/threonine-protein kinase